MPIVPTDYPNLWGWWKSDTGVTGDPNITAWADQSGNNRTMTVPGIMGTPTLDAGGLNGFPGIASSFGTQALATAASIGPLNSGTIYIVAKQAPDDNDFGGFVSAGDNFQITRLSASDEVAGDAATGSILAAPHTPITDDTYYTIRLRITAGTVYLSVNNGAEVSAARNATVIESLTALPVLLFSDGSHNGKKTVVELLIYTDTHTENQRNNVEYYLQQRYNHFTWTGDIPSPSNPTTMSTIDGKSVGLFISTVLSSPAPTDWKEVICATDTGLSGSTDVNTVDTKCGVKKSAGSTNWTMNIAGTADFDPDTGFISGQELIALMQNKTRFLAKIIDNGTTPTYFRQGEAFFSSYNETANNGETVQFDATLEIDGDIDYTV